MYIIFPAYVNKVAHCLSLNLFLGTMMRYYVGFILMLLFFLAGNSNASVHLDCSQPQAITINVAGNYTIQRDVPTGTAISPWFDSGEAWPYSICMGNGSSDLSVGIASTVTPLDQKVFVDGQEYVVYATNVAGVGYIFRSSARYGYTNGGWDTGFLDWWPFPTTTSFQNLQGGWSINAFNYSTGLKVSIRFVKYAKTSSGMITGGGIGKGTADDSSHLGTGLIGTINISSGFNITTLACSLSSNALNFNMGNIEANKFGSTPGTVPSGSDVIQNLGLECDDGANINVSLAGTQNPDVSEDNVLALSGQGDDGVAQGVGVQMLYNGTPLELNKNIVLKKSAGGQETFPIVARYYQTKTAVTPGKADALATLNISYQ